MLATDIVRQIEQNLNSKVYFSIGKYNLEYLHTNTGAEDFEKLNKERENKRTFYLTVRENRSIFNTILGSKPIRRYYIGEATNVKIFIGSKELRKKEKEILRSDTITIENISFSLDNSIITSGNLPIIEIQNLDVEKGGNKILNNVNLTVQRGEFIIVMGPSGCGKTTLLKELAGENEKIAGDIYIDSQSLYDHFHTKLKARVGYVQQFDYLHEDLTVDQILYYTAKIRNVINRRARIQKVKKELNLIELSNNIVRNMSGGQKKRVAIAVEMLDQPEILLLDEPTSPLDPESIKEFLNALKDQSKNFNRTIIMVTHKPTDLNAADRVVFLSTGGYQIYSGPVSEFVPTIERRLGVIHGANYDEKILSFYKKFGTPEAGLEFTKSFKSTPKSMPSQPASYHKKFNGITQWVWLFARYMKSKFPNREEKKRNIKRKIKLLDTLLNVKFYDGWLKNTVTFLLQPILVGSLFFAFPNFNMTALFLIALAVIWFGINNGSKEIVEEINIFKRERSYNIKIDAYLLSKLFALWLISAVQIAVLLVVVWCRYQYFDFGVQEGVNLYAPYWSGVFLLFLSLSSISLGLLISTFSERVDKVLIWVPIFLLAQIIFSGLVSKPDISYKESVTFFMIGRWGLEGLSRIQDRFSEERVDTLINKHPHKTSNSVVIEIIGIPPADTLTYKTAGAIEVLASYNDKHKRDKLKSWEWFDSIEKNTLIIILHGLLTYFLCRLVLLSKDYIPYSPNLTPAKIKFRIIFIILIILIFILNSPGLKNIY